MSVSRRNIRHGIAWSKPPGSWETTKVEHSNSGKVAVGGYALPHALEGIRTSRREPMRTAWAYSLVSCLVGQAKDLPSRER